MQRQEASNQGTESMRVALRYYVKRLMLLENKVENCCHKVFYKLTRLCAWNNYVANQCPRQSRCPHRFNGHAFFLRVERCRLVNLDKVFSVNGNTQCLTRHVANV